MHDSPATAVGAADGPSLAHGSHLNALIRFKDGIIAVVIAFLAQLLIAGIQYLLHGAVDFPPSILAMAGVFVALSMAGWVIPGIEEFYQKRIKRAVSAAGQGCLWLASKH